MTILSREEYQGILPYEEYVKKKENPPRKPPEKTT